MKKWFIANTHFSHANIIRYTSRPNANVEEMDRSLIDSWVQSIGKEDQAFFLGDFGLGDVDHLIRGNHDRNANWMARVGFNVVVESAFLKIGRYLVELIHIPSEQAPTHFQLHGHTIKDHKRSYPINSIYGLVLGLQTCR